MLVLCAKANFGASSSHFPLACSKNILKCAPECLFCISTSPLIHGENAVLEAEVIFPIRESS